MKKQNDRDEAYEILVGGTFNEYMKNPMTFEGRAQAIGNVLRNLRERSEVTQRQMCKALKLTPQTYSGYEAGKHVPPIEMLVRMAYLFNVSLDFLIGRDLYLSKEKADEQFIEQFFENEKLESIVRKLMQLDGRMAAIETAAQEIHQRQKNEVKVDE